MISVVTRSRRTQHSLKLFFLLFSFRQKEKYVFLRHLFLLPNSLFLLWIFGILLLSTALGIFACRYFSSSYLYGAYKISVHKVIYEFLEGVGIDRKIILKLTSNNYGLIMWSGGLNWFHCYVIGRTQCAVKYGEFLDFQNDSLLFKKRRLTNVSISR